MIKRTFHLTVRWVIGAVGALAILLALAIVAVRLVLLQVPEQRAQLQEWVNRATGLEVRLQDLSTHWGKGGPEIYATDVEVYAPNGGPRLAQVRAVSISTDLKRMLSRKEWLSGHVRLIGPEVRLVRTDEGLELEGDPHLHPREPGKHMNSDGLPSGSLEIEDGRVILLDARTNPSASSAGAPGAATREEVIKVQGVRLKLQRDGDLVKFTGDLGLPRRFGGALDFTGQIQGRLDQPRDLHWRTRLAGRDLQLNPWREFFSGRWRGLNPRGQIGALDVTLAGDGLRWPQFKMRARFAGVGVDPFERLPGLSGLAGSVDATDQGGTVRLQSSGFVLNMPYRFREPLAAESVTAAVEWQHTTAMLAPPEGGDAQEKEVWRIVSRGFDVVGPHGKVQGDMELTLPTDGGARVLKLQGQFQDVILKEGWRYLPIDRLRGPKTLAWLDAAFLSGRAPSGEIVFDGPVNKFPFRNGEGLFRVSFAVEGMDMHYGRGWPDLSQIAADVEFRNQGLTGTLRSGRLQGLQITPGARAQIADFRQGELKIEGRARGDLGAALKYLQSSPLGESFGETFARLRGSGPMDGQLDLLLPLKHLAARKLKLSAQLGSNEQRDSVSLQGTDHELRDVRGLLRVEDKQITVKGMLASYLGGPMSIDVRPQAGRRGASSEQVIAVRAQTPAGAVAQKLKVPAKAKLSGTVDWRAVARVSGGIEPGAPRTFTVQIDSDLQGLGIGLPAPLTKAAEESRPLHVDVRWPRTDAAQVAAQYGALLQANLAFEKTAAQWRFARGTVRIGGGLASVPAGPGLTVEGAADRVDLPGWLSLRSDTPGNRKLADVLRGIDLDVGELRLYGFRLPDVKAKMTGGERAWSIVVDGPRSQGTLAVPFDLDGSDPLVIDMAKLDLGEPVASGGEARGGQEPDPTRWPAVNVSVRQFSAWNKQFGFTRASLASAADGLVLQSLTSVGPSFQLEGSGSWKVTAQGQRSQLALRLQSSDVLQTLQHLGYGASITGERGLAVLDLHWSGAPDEKLITRLEGTINVEVDDGRLVSVQPGAGRVFGLMSVATLRRRLALDFSDLTDKGLAFDAIRGDFTLKSGDAYTSNLLLRGPAAEIGIVGRTGLEAKDYDQTAVVTGNLGQSLPVAGALAGGPAVGAALLVFSQIFKQPLKGIARGYYRITGPWEEPTVERVDAEQLKKAEGEVKEEKEGAGSG